MSGITTGVGLISGLNIADIVNALITSERRPTARIEARVQTLQAEQAALKSLEASTLSLATSAGQLNTKSTFGAFAVAGGDTSQLSVTAGTSAAPGDYQFRTLQTARTHEINSRGVANANQQTFGAGKLVISQGGGIAQPTVLDALNGGAGVRRGSIRITDRAGSSAVVDLSSAYTVDDVLAAINGASGVSVAARTDGGRLILEDTTGATTTNLSVTDISGGHAAADLGLAGSVAAATLTGAAVYQVTGDFALTQINDRNGPRFVTGNDLRITLSDDTVLDIDLDGAATVGDVLKKINNAEGNGGKLAATLSDGRIVLEDQSGGGGTAAFSVENLNGARVVGELGLSTAASGDTLTGGRLVAGIGSVLLRNLRGGQGIDQPGPLSLTDRAGNSATIDLSAAESLDEVINAINSAQTGGGDPLALRARLNAQGTGIEIIDTSGATASNLIVADLGGGTLAADLGIAIDAAATAIDSGSLHLRYVNEATPLAGYRLDGTAVGAGTFRITDSSGASAVVSITANDKTIGDVLAKINAAAGINVTAKLSDTGDGIALVDDAGGAAALTVTSLSGTAAKDLFLVGTGTLNAESKSELNGRRAVTIDVEADDTLDEIAKKINAAGVGVAASVVNSGNPVNPVRLVVRSAQSGSGGNLFVDEGNLGLGFSTRVQGRDAILQVGGDAASAFYVASKTNRFNNVLTGINVEVKQAGSDVADVRVTRDPSKADAALKSLVTAYNTFLTAFQDATKFDAATNSRGTLQGNGLALRLKSRLDAALGGLFGGAGASVRFLQDVGISVGQDGKLSLDSARLAQAVADDPQAVSDFFLTAKTGFAATLKSALDAFTDPVRGAFKLEYDARESSVAAMNLRIEQRDAVLLVRRDRLLKKYIDMEAVLAELQQAQTTLSGIKLIRRESSE